jgi:type VI secretion system protein ImpC
MSSDRDRFRIDLDVDAGGPRRTPRPSNAPGRLTAPASGPFRIALIGDFSARSYKSSGEEHALKARRPIRVDRDSLDDAIAMMKPKLLIPMAEGDAPIEVAFASMDDFHPDRLYQRLPYFRALRESSARVTAAASVMPALTPTPVESPTDVLAAILGDVPPPPGGAALARPATKPALDQRVDAGFSEFVDRAVRPHLVESPKPAETAVQRDIAAAVTTAMRSLLHDAHFQRLESAWRSAEMLVRRLDTDTTLQIYLVDITDEELAEDLSQERPPDELGLYRLLQENTALSQRSENWALLVTAFSLGADPVLLGRFGAVARAAGAPLIIAADPLLAGVDDIGAAPDPDDWSEQAPAGWNELRSSSVSPWIAAVFPRLLLRLPYGKRSDSCELFDFEELEPNLAPKHDDLLWGSGAVAAALILGEAFAEMGWNLHPKRTIANLPLHIYKMNEESFATPCAEVLLPDRIAERLVDRGLSPVLAVRDSDEAFLPRLQSIAARPAALQGRWNEPIL